MATQADELVLDEVITVTDRARERLVELRDAEEEGNRLGLRISVAGNQGLDFLYDLEFVTLATCDLSDAIRNHQGLRVIVPAVDVGKLQGATLDLEDDGLVMRNPNRPEAPNLGALAISGPLVEAVQGELDNQINPALAAHGGFVVLAGVDEDDGSVYLRMGGGCQGCAMSRMTMIQGVQASLREAIPQVTRVVDVTDHAAGDQPYYR